MPTRNYTSRDIERLRSRLEREPTPLRRLRCCSAVLTHASSTQCCGCTCTCRIRNWIARWISIGCMLYMPAILLRPHTHAALLGSAKQSEARTIRQSGAGYSVHTRRCSIGPHCSFAVADEAANSCANPVFCGHVHIKLPTANPANPQLQFSLCCRPPRLNP